jgi:hypothetical protein
MRLLSRQAIVLCVSAACATAATADEKLFDFSGFGTAGFAWSDTSKAQFNRDLQPLGVDKNGDVGLDSVLGAQATVHLTPDISATSQLMYRRSFEKNFTLDVTLGFLKDQVTPDFALRGGRLQLPVFMISEYRQVGYVNTFIRPPVEVYGQSPLDYVDGVDGQYVHSFGPVDVSAAALYGNATLNYSLGEIDLRRAAGANISANWGPATLHYGRLMGELSLVTDTADQLIDAVQGAGFTTLADRLSEHNRAYDVTDWGLSVDWHDILVQGEYSDRQAEGYVSSSRGRYALVGYRIHKFTPFASYAERNATGWASYYTVPQGGPPAPLASGVNALLAADRYEYQHTSSVGVRWDFHDSMDMKFQLDHVSPKGPGLFVNAQTGFSGPVDVVALAVDFVF